MNKPECCDGSTLTDFTNSDQNALFKKKKKCELFFKLNAPQWLMIFLMTNMIYAVLNGFDIHFNVAKRDYQGKS